MHHINHPSTASKQDRFALVRDRELRDLIKRIESDYDTIFGALENDAGDDHYRSVLYEHYRGILYSILDTLGEAATYLDRLRKPQS